MQLSVVLVVISIIMGYSNACFITNCPPGGKRSMPSSHIGHTRTCTSCGPGLQGRCLGPEICCGETIGCFLGTRESQICRTENLIPVTCNNSDLKTCGVSRSGHCSAVGLCCTEAKCEFDINCISEGSQIGRRLPFGSPDSEDQWNL
ncbi:oxytocin-neurophysin 1-like [Macrobrachium nipponense]|uniref:oxytocin-neurophysin 1-like n=1 Tax=Macrobrachium nipponense TaxID=159736 RepID=UPI0030C7A982